MLISFYQENVLRKQYSLTPTTTLQQLYDEQIIPLCCRLSYIDEEGDTVDILCDKDLTTLMQLQLQNICIEITPHCEIGLQAHFSPPSKQQKYLQFEEKHQDDCLKTEFQEIHKGVQCNNCKVQSIVGVRYMCGVCFKYNLCGWCEREDVHSMHPMLKINRVAQTPIAISLTFTKEDGITVASYLSQILSLQFNQCYKFVKKHQPIDKERALKLIVEQKVKNGNNQPSIWTKVMKLFA